MTNSILKKNMAALISHAALHKKIVDLKDLNSREGYLIQNSKTNHPTLIHNDASGKQTTYHSKYDPIKEATRLLDSSYNGQTHAFILGFGLGYLTEKLFEKLPKARGKQLYIIEPDLQVFYSALLVRDLTPLLSSPSILWCVGMTPDEVGEIWHSALDWAAMHSLAIIEHAASIGRFKDYFERIVEKIRYFSHRSKGNLITLMKATYEYHTNFFENLAPSFVMPGVQRLFGLFKGVPAIVVAAGPSLDKNVHLLKEIKGKFPIMAVDTALRQLAAHGIKPDIACAADPSYENSLDFVGMEDEKEVLLVLEPMAHPDIFEYYTGPKMITSFGGGLYKIINPLREPMGLLISWGSIATTVFDLARKVEADPIVFIGLDLSFQDGKIHAKGSYSDDTMFESLHPYNSIEHQTAAYINTYGVNALLRGDGEVIYTDQNMKIYKDWFEDQFRQTQQKVINATEGGIVSKYVELCTLRDVIDKYQHKAIDVRARIKQALEKPVEFDTSALVNKITEIKKSIRQNENMIRKLVSVIKRLYSAVSSQKVSEVIGRNKVDFLDILKFHDKLCANPELFEWFSSHQTRFITRHTMKLNALKANQEATVRDWLEIVSEFFDATTKFYEYQFPLLDEAAIKLSESHATAMEHLS